jgi:hypothetical protein
LLAILVIAPAAVARLKPVDAPMTFAANLAILAAAYCLAGLIIGLATDWAPFYWIMLISYLPAHAVAGWSFGWFPFSTLMFVVAFSTRQALRRRKLIFES